MAQAAHKRRRTVNRGNPRAASDDMYESFHGEPSDETIEYENEEHYHSHLAALGELVELKVKLVAGGTAVIGFEDNGDTAKNPKSKKKKGRGFWPFNSFTHTTIYHVGTGKKAGTEKKVKVATAPKSKVVGEFRGYKIEKQDAGYVVPGIDSSVYFDRASDAKLFIASMSGSNKATLKNPLVEHYKAWRKKNPKSKGPIRSAISAGSSVVDYLDGQLGRALNPTNKDTGPTMLCSNEDGTQLYFVGGSQKLDLSGLGISGSAADKELITVGSVTNIVYHARKVFDKPEEFDYVHKFSEDSHGPLPILLYDRMNTQLKLSGGVYKIERPLTGTSPGIED